MKNSLITESRVPATAEKLFGWHENEGALIRLMPPWEKVRVVTPFQGLGDGVRVRFQVQNGPMKFEWTAEHFGYRKNELFCDRALSGPFKSFVHHHRFLAQPDGSTVLRDEVEYELPVTPLSDPIAGGFVRGKLDSMFRYRHRVMQGDVKAQLRHALPPSRVLISGANGLIGRQMFGYLRQAGHTVIRLVRSKSEVVAGQTILWDPMSPFPKERLAELEGFDAVIHLAGAGIADQRWSEKRKREIRESRVQGTKHLADALCFLNQRPKVFLCGSAIGIYGNEGDALLTENSPTNSPGFLEDVARDWEGAARCLEKTGVRTVYVRTGIVLSPAGGALAKMLFPFQCNVGGVLGNGKAWMSWIALDDMLSGMEFILATEAIHGPVNFTAPCPVTNREFTHTLAKTLGRFVGPPVPTFALKTLFGEMADAALLASLRVEPQVLLNHGYRFRYPDLRSALGHVLGYSDELGEDKP